MVITKNKCFYVSIFSGQYHSIIAPYLFIYLCIPKATQTWQLTVLKHIIIIVVVVVVVVGVVVVVTRIA